VDRRSSQQLRVVVAASAVGTSLALPPLTMLQTTNLPIPRASIVLWGARRGPVARAAALRADAKLWLLRVAMQAQREARNEARELGALTSLLDGAGERLRDYCDYVQRELEPMFSARSSFATGAFKHFVQRSRRELYQLGSLIEHAPRSRAVAHRVFATAFMLVRELDAQDRELAA
jgi:hypothetical protein